MTLCYRGENPKVFIEVPLDQEKKFIILSFLLLNEQGKSVYVRKVFEVVREKKLKTLLNQQLVIQTDDKSKE